MFYRQKAMFYPLKRNEKNAIGTKLADRVYTQMNINPSLNSYFL